MSSDTPAGAFLRFSLMNFYSGLLRYFISEPLIPARKAEAAPPGEHIERSI